MDIGIGLAITLADHVKKRDLHMNSREVEEL